MKLTNFLTLAFCMLIAVAAQAQTIVGTWKTVDDETGKEKSKVEIYQQGNEFFGKITQLLLPEDKGKICNVCTGADKGKPVEGLVIVKKLKKVGKYWQDGTILDPKNGKEYKCYIEPVGGNKLKVRGYIGVAALGRTQYWYKA